MINVSEIMIGNWVRTPNEERFRDKYRDQPYLVENWQDIRDIANDPKDYEPIPLNDGIMQKCGFRTFGTDSISGKTIWSKEISFIHNDSQKGVYFLLNGYHVIDNRLSVSTLHQLQNLYFMLVGKSLIYQP